MDFRVEGFYGLRNLGIMGFEFSSLRLQDLELKCLRFKDLGMLSLATYDLKDV